VAVALVLLLLVTTSGKAGSGSEYFRALIKVPSIGAYQCDSVGCASDVAIVPIQVDGLVVPQQVVVTVAFRYRTSSRDEGLLTVSYGSTQRPWRIRPAPHGSSETARMVFPYTPTPPNVMELEFQLQLRPNKGTADQGIVRTGRALITIEGAA
jgi:hypothetical protein